MGEFGSLHESCRCNEHEGEYSGDWCREAPEGTTERECGHPGCQGTS
jgi:hypothetical protein